MLQIEPKIAVSINMYIEIKKQRKRETVDKKQLPETPMNLPKSRHDKQLKKGKNRIQRNIKG
jgi:hypothetical protein